MHIYVIILTLSIIQINPYFKEPAFLGKLFLYLAVRLVLILYIIAISPKGLVPVLEVDNGSICDSWVICEYLEETFPDQSPLLPKDPYQRSIARTWIDFINKSIVPAFFRLLQAQPEETEKRAKALAEFNTALGKLSEKHKGPFFFGDKISLVDIFIAPWAVRDFILRDYREFKRSMVQGWAD